MSIRARLLGDDTVLMSFRDISERYALRDAQRLRRKRPNSDLAKIAGLLESDKESIRKNAIALAGTWRLGGEVPRLAKDEVSVQ